MKKLIVTVALATLVASPAFAQSNSNLVRHSATAAENSNAVGWNASAHNPNVVVYGNTVVGQDPDANVRLQLSRDPIPLSQ